MRRVWFLVQFLLLSVALTVVVSCRFGQSKLTLKEEALNAMVGLNALQYQDFKFWYHKIENRALVNKEMEAEATMLLLQASEKLIYWKESQQDIDSLLALAFSKATDDSLVAAIQLRKADFLISLDQFDSAKRLIDRADHSLPTNLEIERAYLRFRTDAIHHAPQSLNKVIDSLKNTGLSQDLLLKFLTKSGDIAYNQGHFEWSSFYYREALKIAERIGWGGFQAKLLVELADVCLINDQLDSVRYFVEKANDILLKIPGPLTACNGYTLAARAQLRLGETTLAKENFQTLLKIATEINSPKNKLKAFLGLSEAALLSKEWKLADSLVQNAISLVNAANDDVLTHQAYFMASKASSALGLVNEALNYLEITEKLERGSNDTTELIVTIDEKIRLLLNVGSVKLLEELFEEQEKLIEAYPNKQAKLSLYQLKSDWLASIGDFKGANIMANRYDELQNSINLVDDSKIKKINELQRNVISREAELQTSKDKLSEAKIKLLFLVGTAFLILVFLIIIFYLRIRSDIAKIEKIKNDLLEVENQKIKLEADYIQLKKMTDQYLKYKKLEFELFESWSSLSDRKGIAVLRFNVILYYHLRNSLNYLKKALNIKTTDKGLNSSKESVAPISFKSDWEASWKTLKIFHPCTVDIFVPESLIWNEDVHKLKILIDILVRRFMAKSHDRKELIIRLFEKGFSMESSLLYEHDLIELLVYEDISESIFSKTSAELQNRTSKIVIAELINELNIKTHFEKDLDLARIKFEFR